MRTQTRGWMGAAGVAVLVVVAAAATARRALAAAEKEVTPDPSRSTPVHRIALFNEDNEQVKPDADPALAFSQKVSCNKCHDYQKVSGGWHFNEADPNAAPGRPGQAWIYTDVATGTQVPVTNRAWPGTWKPADLGLTAWKFVQTFGRHFPGGGVGDRFALKFPDPAERWLISGNVEINCLACHHADFRQDQSHYAEHMERENFRWAGTAASGLAAIGGYVKLLPSTYDPLLGEAPDNPQYVPRVEYDKSRFNSKGEVYLDVVRKAPNDRCYYCHTNHPVGQQEWQVPEDVHMARGFTCADCHRNGLDHKIGRNYEGEKGVAKGTSCRGCHLGEDEGATQALREGGHGAAPRPAHAGFPKLHLDNLSCTACHSGLWPGPEARRIQTGRAHALGYHGIAYDPKAPPVIQEPVFVKQYDGKIAPHRMVFPAFWGRLKDQAVQPLAPQAVVQATGSTLATPKDKRPKPPTAEQVTGALKALAAQKGAGEPVYVAGGKLHRLDAGGKLAASDHPAARPYSWPLAHDVRPVAQSLGYGGAVGCGHCHSSDSAFLFGRVVAESPAALGPAEGLPMHTFSQQDATFHKLFGLTFLFRPWLKAFGFVVSGVVGLILLAYGLPGVAVVLRRFSRRAPEP